MLDPRINEKPGEPSSERVRNASGIWLGWGGPCLWKRVTLEEVMSSTLSPYGSLLKIQSPSRKAESALPPWVLCPWVGGKVPWFSESLRLCTISERKFFQRKLRSSWSNYSEWILGFQKPTSVLCSNAETMTVRIFTNGGEEDALGRRLPHSDHILPESDRILSDTSHTVRTEWCSLLLRQFLFTEARPACNQSRQTSTSCDLMNSWKPPLPTLSL